MQPPSLTSRDFVQHTRSLVESRNVERLVEYLRAEWPPEHLAAMLDVDDEETVKLALVSLALVGECDQAPKVAQQLHDADDYTAGLAEHALWNIWFRAGSPTSVGMLREAVDCLAEKRVGEAKRLLTVLTLEEPEFAEAHHQHAIACLADGDHDRAIRSGRRALALNPDHFGVLTTLGHAYACTGRYARALQWYHAALRAHPRLKGIAPCIEAITKRIRQPQTSAEAAPQPLRQRA